MKQIMKRVFGFALSLAMVAGMLPVSVLATEECAHTELEKGVCKSCEVAFVAQVGTELYQTLDGAIEAAAEAEDPAITVLTDLSGVTQELGNAYLVVKGKELLTFADCTFTGENADYILMNQGSMILRNVKIENKGGGYALYGECGEGRDLLEMTVLGGEYIGQRYGIGLKQMKLQLNGYSTKQVNPETQEQEDVFAVPVVQGADADFHLEDSAIEVMCDLGENTQYSVECTAPGGVIFTMEYADVELNENWFVIKTVVPVVSWDQTTEQLAYTGETAVLTSKATVQLLNEEVYSGEIIYAYRAEGESEFTEGLPVQAGTYQIKAAVAAFENYAAAETAELLTLTIGQKTDAALTLEVKTPEGGYAYTGSAIEPEVTVKDGETTLSADQYEVYYENNTNAGTATVIVKAKADGSYAFADLKATFEIQKASGTALAISGQPKSVTYGDQAFQLSTSGGLSGTVVWSVTEGSEIADVSEDGIVMIKGVGKVTVKAAQSGDSNYNAQSAEWSFEVKPAVLTVKSATAENKIYDGTKTVAVHEVVLSGIVGTDIVSVSVDGLKGELTDAKVGTYTKITLPALTLNGVDAAKYTLSRSSEVSTNVTIEQKTDAKLTLEVKTPEGGYTYTGSAIVPEVTVKDGKTVLSADQYEVYYENNTNAGTATVIVKAKAGGNYVFKDLKTTFDIKKATAAALTIGGQPKSVTYGDQAFRLTASGGLNGSAVSWSVTEGSGAASISADGTVTVKGVGKVTVKAVQNGDANHNAQSAEYAFEVKPAVLTVDSVTCENKSYDGNKTVVVKSVVLKGVLNNDKVSVSVNGLKGQLAAAKAAVYNQVTVSGLKLTGVDAAKYTLTQPTAAVKTNVTVSKAEIPAALADKSLTVAVDTAELSVEKLGEGMPEDAGELRYTTKHQDTADGSKVIVLDWGVDTNGKLTSKLAGAAAGDKVIYEVTVSSDNYKDTVVKVEVTLGSIAVEASKITVTPSATELEYNGKEQKPTVEVQYDGVALKADTDYEVTYPEDTVSVGEKELTVQFKGNYSGTATAKYTVTKAKVSVSGVQAKDKTYDGTTSADVTATLSGVAEGDDVTVTAVGTFTDKNSGSGKTVNVTYTLSGEDADNYELTATTGTTTARIYAVSSTSLNSRISGLSTANADSGDKSTLQSVVSQANAALQDGGLSSAEKSGLSNVKWTAEDMISRIESAAAAAATESIRKSADIRDENVKIEDKALLVKAQADLNYALTTYGSNYTDAEKTEIKNKLERIEGALDVISRVENAQMLIEALPAQITETTVKDAALKTSVENAQTAYNALNDYEKSLLGEDAEEKLTAAVKALDGVQPEEDEEKDEVTNQITSAPEEGEGFKFPTWILVVAVIAAAVCGGGLYLFKRKQEEESLNW